MLYTCTDKLPCLYKGTLVIAQSGDGMAETIIIITCLLACSNSPTNNGPKMWSFMLAGWLVATRSIKLALVHRPPQVVVQRHSIPHCALVSRPYSTQNHLLLHRLHRCSIPPPASCTLHFSSLVSFTASLYTPPARLPACLQPRDSKTHVEKRLCFCLLPRSGLTLRQTIPPPLISTPKPGSSSRLPLGHHITSDCGVQEHESARPAARW